MNPSPPNLKYTVSYDQPTVAEMVGCSTSGSANGTCSPTNVNNINITWSDPPNDSFGLAPNGSCSDLNPESGGTTQWKSQNVLRVELIPLISGMSLSRDSLIGDSYTAFLCPNNQAPSAQSVNISTDMGVASGEVLDSYCTPISGTSAPYDCSVNLNVSSFTTSQFVLVVRGMYGTSTATISVNGGSTPIDTNPLDIADAQLLVDSTGKSQNVLKRIQVRIPETNTYTLPDGVEQGEVCKQLDLLPTELDNPDIPHSMDNSPCANFSDLAP